MTWFIAIVFSAIGVGSFFHFIWIIIHWEQTEAVVIGNKAVNMRHMSSAHNISQKINSWMPKLSFTANGQTYHVVGGSGRSEMWEIGERLSLYFKPSNPNHTMSLNFWGRLLFNAAFAGAGLACILKLNGVIG